MRESEYTLVVVYGASKNNKNNELHLLFIIICHLSFREHRRIKVLDSTRNPIKSNLFNTENKHILTYYGHTSHMDYKG